MSRHVGFSGTRNGLTRECETMLWARLAKLYAEGAVFHHGCCIGADVKAAKIAHHLRYRIVAHPPIKKDCLAPESEWFADAVMEPNGYFARNREIVLCTDVLVACPPTLEWQPNGGTWYTIDFARRDADRKVIIIGPNGHMVG